MRANILARARLECLFGAAQNFAKNGLDNFHIASGDPKCLHNVPKEMIGVRFVRWKRAGRE